MRRKNLWLLMSAVIIIAMLLTACKTEESTTTTTAATTTATTTAATTTVTTSVTTVTTTTTAAGMPKYGGTFNFPLSADLTSFDSWSTNPHAFAMMIYDQLMSGNILLTPEEYPYYGEYKTLESGSLVGCLLESWEVKGIEGNVGTVILHLRQGIHFQNLPPVNGRELTADDVVYSFQRAVSAQSSVATSQMLRDRLASITALDKYTFEYKYNLNFTAVGWYEVFHRNTWPVAKEVVDKYGGSLGNPIGQVGTGPYIIKDYVPGSTLTYTRNPDYWGTDPRFPGNKLPYIDTVIETVIPDLSTRLAALRTGKISMMTGVAWDQADSLIKTNPELMKRQIKSESGVWISQRNDLLPFHDIRVRQALSMSIDRHAIVDQYYKGNANYSYYFIPAHWADYYIPLEEFSQDIQDIYNYHPDKARQLLADAGYPDGFKTECMISSTNTNAIEVMQLVKAWWLENLNVDVNIKVMDPAAWTSLQQKHTFPGMSVSGGGLATPTSGFSYIYQPLGTFRVYNSSNYYDPIFIEKYEGYLASWNLPDAERKVLFRELMTFVREQTPLIDLPNPNNYYFWQPWIKGYWGQTCFAISSGGFAGDIWKYMWIDKD